jgi:glycerophosphoryl diester phosphodiesterase
MIGFAHRGARAYAPENTIEAFRLALRLGATGVESDVWLTRDGVPVLDHDGIVKQRLRRIPIGNCLRVDLPDHIPTLADLLDLVGDDVPISLDVKDPAAFDAARAVLDSRPNRHPNDTYLCHPDLALLASQRKLLVRSRLVHSTRLASMKDGPERHAARLRDAGIEVVNMPYPDWSGGLVALFGRFGLMSFSWDCQHERQIAEVKRMGVDAVYSDWPDRLADGLRD